MAFLNSVGGTAVHSSSSTPFCQQFPKILNILVVHYGAAQIITKLSIHIYL